jgi:hypothetical protein
MPRFIAVLGDIRTAIPASGCLATFAMYLILQMRRREAVADPVAFGATPDMTELGTREILDRADAGQASSRTRRCKSLRSRSTGCSPRLELMIPPGALLSNWCAVPDREQRSGYGACIVDVASNVTRQIATWHPKQDRDPGPSSHHLLCHDPINE